MKASPSIEAEKQFKMYRIRPSVISSPYYILVSANFESPEFFRGSSLILSPDLAFPSGIQPFSCRNDLDEPLSPIISTDLFFSLVFEAAIPQLMNHLSSLASAGIIKSENLLSPHLIEEIANVDDEFSKIILRGSQENTRLLLEFSQCNLQTSTQLRIKQLASVKKVLMFKTE
jgi:hypothetical protein